MLSLIIYVRNIFFYDECVRLKISNIIELYTIVVISGAKKDQNQEMISKISKLTRRPKNGSP